MEAVSPARPLGAGSSPQSGAREASEATSSSAPAGPSATYWSLNVVRIVLGMAVLLYHLGATIALDKYFGFAGFESVFGFGGARIPFFFVLSGFLLTLVYAKDFGRAHKAPSFLWRRFVRIYPTYWVILLLVMSPALLLPGLRDAIPDDPWVLAQTFLLVPQRPEVAGPTGAPIIVAAWTLHYELALYLILAAWVWSRTLGMALVGALALNAVVCAQGQCGFYSSFFAGSAFMYFAYGAAAAWLLRRLPDLPNAELLVWVGAVAYFLVAVMTYEQSDGRHDNDPSLYYGMLASLILVCLTKAEAARPAVPGPRWVKLLSDSSYVMYLLHFPIISLMCKLVIGFGLRGVDGAVVALVTTVAVCVLAAVGFHLLIERRLLALRS